LGGGAVSPRVAVIGAGIAGLGAARALTAGGASVTLYEAQAHFGGHAQTVPVTLDGVRHGVDIGFLVFNHRTYPRLTRLFEQLGVDTAASEMSFSVQSRALGWEWSGSSLAGVFAQPANLVSPRFWGLLAEILRFNRLATAASAGAGDESLGDWLQRHHFGATLREGYLLPMLGCIWSCPTDRMMQFPVAMLLRFCHNHGLLQLRDRPAWRTVRGGSASYVRKLIAGLHDARLATPVQALQRRSDHGVTVFTDSGASVYDHVVLACHSDQALRLLADQASASERRLLGALRYQPNRVVLHTDPTLLPRRQRAWAAWNCERGPDADAAPGICLHYLINRLQPLPWRRPVIVSMNPLREPRADQVLGEWPLSHPILDRAAVTAQSRLGEIQGRGGVWFCGAWTGYGFHEDGLASGEDVAQALLAADADAGTERAA
jgi:predicted NAD/FAD-binding protein